jgi:tetratricopeptide (TPR) repeat protein
MRRVIPAALLFSVLMSWACHERIVVYPPPKVPRISSPPSGEAVNIRPVLPGDMGDSMPSKSPKKPEILVQADLLFRQGEYAQAIDEYDTYLENNPATRSRERILFNIGLGYALASGRDRNFSKMETALNQLLEEFPESRYRSGVQLIFELIAQIRRLDSSVKTRNSEITRLEEELKRLKEIDLNRRPSQPSR